jgi:hypothetical protein
VPVKSKRAWFSEALPEDRSPPRIVRSTRPGLTEYGGRAYLVCESGSYKYRSDPKTKNVITRLHKASISSLTGLV